MMAIPRLRTRCTRAPLGMKTEFPFGVHLLSFVARDDASAITPAYASVTLARVTRMPNHNAFHRSSDHESARRAVPRGTCSDRRCSRDGIPSSSQPGSAEKLSRSAENRGMMWIVGGFILCPCHLPLTLAALGAALAGTAVGTMLREHVIVSALIITAAWALATWRGVWLVRAARAST